MAERLPGRAESADAGVSCDAILDGKVNLYQFRKGHRAGTDAVLLAAAAPSAAQGLVLDVGAGVGTAGLILAARCPSLQLGLIENDSHVAALAAENLVLNNLDARACVYEADIFSAASRRAAGLAPGMAELVLTNPPFGDPDRVRASPLASKRGAHVMPKSVTTGTRGADPLTAWIRACLALLQPGGTFVMIHRPEAMLDILAAIGHRIGDISLLPVHPQKNKAASRILLRGTQGSRAPLTIAQSLVLQDQGRFTPLAEAIHRGEALIDWS